MLLKPFDKLEQRYTGRLANVAQFDQIESPFARLVLRDERLRLLESCSQVLLPKTGG